MENETNCNLRDIAVKRAPPAGMRKRSTMKQKSEKAKPELTVDILEARPNKMFSEQQRSLIRFLRYNRPAACACCGRKKRTLWTMTHDFLATALPEEWNISGPGPGKPFARLTGVCQDHCLMEDRS